MTEKLYYSEPRRLEFKARVVAVGVEKSGVRVALDRTCFYPEGGGQPADRGTLGGVPVRTVQKQGDVVWHWLDSASAKSSLSGAGTEAGAEGAAQDASAGATAGLTEGKLVNGRVDGVHRFEYMQQHTGQHIISAAFHRLYGYPTVSVHHGSAYTTVELDTDTVSEAELETVQQQANAVIRDNLAVSVAEVSDEDLPRFPLRREPTVAGTVRVVQLGEFDCVACGGLHTERTGLVQLVNCVSVERIRGRVRSAWKIGDRALGDYREKTAVVNELGTLFSAQQHDLCEKVRKAITGTAELQKRHGAVERRLAGELAARLRREAEDAAHGAAPAGGAGGASEAFAAGGMQRRAASAAPLVITAQFDGDNPAFVRVLVDTLIGAGGAAVCVVNRSAGALQWWIGVSSDVGFELAEHKARLLAPIAGKGGGRRPVWQGAGENAAGVSEFFAVFADLVQSHDSGFARE